LERTLVLVKPDGVQRGLIGEIIGRFERRGLRLVGMKFVWASEELAERHYAPHKGKPFYPGLIRFITSGPVVAMVWEGTQAIEKVRKMMGKTKPAEADLGTIRGDLAMDMGQNLVHGSDGPETSATEIAIWFSPEELVEWARSIDTWVFEPQES
jgi:nucleoside-diphosphate kinase